MLSPWKLQTSTAHPTVYPKANKKDVQEFILHPSGGKANQIEPQKQISPITGFFFLSFTDKG